MTPPVEPRAFIAWCRENRPSGESVCRLMELADTTTYARHPHDETLRLCDMAELRLDLADARAQVEDWKRMHALGEVSERQAIAHFTAQVATLESSLSASRAALRGAEEQLRAEVAERKRVKVHIGASALTRDLVWCECSRGLSRTGNWKFCPKCGHEIDQDSYQAACAEAEKNGACIQAKKFLEPDLVEPGRTVFWSLVDVIAKTVPAESLPAAVAGQPPCNRCGCPALNHCGTGCLSGSRTSSACTCPLTLTQVIAQGALDSGPPQANCQQQLATAREWLREMIAAAHCIRHWHNTGRNDEGMVVSSEHVFKLWEVRDRIEGLAALSPSTGEAQGE